MKYNKFNIIARASILACAPFCMISTASAASGTWIGISYGDLWSNTANWTGGIIADGAANNADFSTLDLPEGLMAVELDSPRTLGSLTFGDTDITTGSAGSWLLENNFDALNILTLSGTPTVTVNALGNIAGTPATAQISAEIAGTGGLIKAGAGPLILSGINTFTGATTVNAGTLSLNAANAYAGGTTVNTGATLNINAATSIGTGTLTIAGGSLGTTTGTTLTTNNTQTWSSNVTFAGPLNLNLGTGAVATGGIAREVISNVGTLTVGGVLTSPGLTKSGAGTLALNGNNLASLTGGTTFKAGTVVLGGGQANVQNAIGVTNGMLTFEGGTLTLNQGTFNSTTWGNLANPITVAAGQTGTLNCPPRGGWSSAVTGSGTFNVAVRDTRWDFSGNFTGFSGTLNISSSTVGNGDFRMSAAGAAGVVFNAGMTVNISNASVYQSNNPPNSGALTSTHQIGKLTGTAAAFLGGSATGGRFVNWQVGALNQDSEYAGVIGNSSGFARLVKVGTATLTMSGANTYTGDTLLNAGKLQIGNGGATGSLAASNVITVAGTELIFNRDNTVVSTYPGIISGPGTITKLGNGQVNFNGVNTYTVGTAIKGGTIGINSASSLGAVAGAVNFTVANGGILATVPGVVDAHTYNVATGLTASFGASTAADSLEVTTSIAGAGNLGVNGLGVLTLSGANAYAGTTTVTSGTLVAANVSGSATSGGAVALNGGTLGGTGTITGAVTTATGSGLKPGAVTPTSTAVGNLTVGGLALAGGTTLNTEFASAVSYDKVIVTAASALTSSASLANPVMVDLRAANSVSKWSTPGTYDLIQFTGTFTGSADDLFEVTPASQQIGNTYVFTNTGSAIRLTITGPIPHIWNVNASGTWTTAGNWDTGAPNSVGAIAHFAGAISGPQSVTLNANQTSGTLLFNNSNAYTIDGTSTLTLDQFLTGNAEINVLLGSHTISAPLSLVDSLAITLNGATDSISLLGNISGSVGISKVSPGNLTLGGNNSSLSGPVTFSNGTLTFANNGLGTGNLTLDNASLVWAPGNSQDITVGRTITFGNNPIKFSMDTDVTLANNFGLTGTANLTKDGSGMLTLTANTTFAGSLTVLNGNLTLGDGGATGSTAGAINLANASTIMTVSRSGDHTIGNLISGTGSLVLDGTGLQSLSQANTFNGTTTINGGSAVLTNVLALQSSTVLYGAAGGALNFSTNFAATLGALSGDKDLALLNADVVPGNVTLTVGGNNATTAYTGILSGGGSLTKTGTGTMTLTGAHTFTGATQVNGGALELDPTVTLNNTTVSVGGSGRLTSNSATIAASQPSNVANSTAGGAVLQILGGTATYAGSLNSVGNANQQARIQVDGGTLTVASMQLGRTAQSITAEPAAGSLTDGLTINGGAVSIAGALNLWHTSANSSINTRMDSGSLTVGGVVTVGLNNGGRWSVLHVAGGTFSGADAVTGVQLGATTQGNAAFLVSGGTATAERFQFGQGALGGTSVVHVSGGELYVGSGGMVVGTSEPGFVSTLRLSGGVLGAKAPWSTAIPVLTANSFTVKAADASNAAQNITLTGPISDDADINTAPGSLIKTGAGTLTISGAYSYTGSTKVDAGTLVLTTATLSDTGSVDVSATAALNLPHGVIDTVSDFLINGVSQGPGTYNAGNTGGRITGTGSLLVVNPDPFTAWASGFGLAGANALPGADPDGDGQNNALEFALNSNPTSGASSGKERTAISLVLGENALTYTLPVRTGAAFSGATSQSATIDLLTYTIDGSDTLTAWGSMVISEVTPALSAGLPALDTGWTYRTFRTPGAVTADPSDFIRCKVVK